MTHYSGSGDTLRAFALETLERGGKKKSEVNWIVQWDNTEVSY